MGCFGTIETPQTSSSAVMSSDTFQVQARKPRVTFDTWENEILLAVESPTRSKPPTVLG